MKKIALVIILTGSIVPCLAQDLDMSLYTLDQIKSAVMGHYTAVGEWETEIMNEGEEERKANFEKLKSENKRIRGLYDNTSEPALATIPESEGLSGVYWYSIAEMMEEAGITPEESGIAVPDANGALVVETSAVGKDMFKWIIPDGLRAGDIFTDEDDGWSYILANGTQAGYNEKVKLVKAHGFTIDASENAVPGQVSIYQADSGSGYHVTVMLYQKRLSILFEKSE